MEPIHGTDGRDILNGTSLADTIFGYGDNDRLMGHGGNDTIRGGGGQDIIEGGDGNDLLFADSNGGGREEDVLFGGAGSDILVSGTGTDHFNGGSGVDAASWQESAFAVTASMAIGTAFSGASPFSGVFDTFTGIENLIGSRFGDTLHGDSGANGLFGGAGNDLLFGGAGNDELSGGAGNDTLDGGAGGFSNTLRGGSGADTVDYSGQTVGIDVDLDEGFVSAVDRFDRLAEIEVVRGSDFADDFEGDAFGNQFFGNGGNDVIDGGQGNDVLAGGVGADRFEFHATNLGGKGRDPFDSGFDRIGDFSRSQGDTIDLTGHFEATDFATLRAEANQLGADTHLRLGDDTIVIEDVTLAELSASMFLF